MAEDTYIEKVAKRVFCDVTELCNLPPRPREWPKINGTSKRQIDFGESCRTTCLKRWKPDLPGPVYSALETIADAGWWIIHKNVEADSIGWPAQWTKGEEPPVAQGNGQPIEFQCPGCGVSRTNKAHCEVPYCPHYMPKPFTESVHDPLFTPPTEPQVVEFETFARKAAMSPEMAYLTIMALFYRQTKNPTVLKKFMESRQKVSGYLDAIDQILGSPGAD